MRRAMKAVPFVVLCALILAVPYAWAYWVQDGTILCSANSDQMYPKVTSDGAGGAIVTWQDARSGDWEIYARRVNASGTEQWTADGVALSTAPAGQYAPMITSDGAGGAIVVWHGGVGFDIHAQRVNASGAVQWAVNGVAVCTAAGNQLVPTITSDGAGGAIVTWHDNRSGNSDIYAQRVNASGTVLWTADGVAMCAATGDQLNPQITSDGAGGAIMTWHDKRTTTFDIHAQRVNASGAVQWAADGVALSKATGDQTFPTITSDGAAGAIVTWNDVRTGTLDIYARRVTAAGAVLWTADGVAVCTAAATQASPVITSDAAGGAIITWYDFRNSNWDIYAQRVDAAGAVQWTANGVAVCSAAATQDLPAINSDDSGGAIVSWRDSRNGDKDIYAQRVNASGMMQWSANGVALCTAPGDQEWPAITSGGAAGAIVAWHDARTGSNDIHAQSIDASGRVGFLAPSINAIRDVPGDQGGKVYLSWYSARSDVFMDSQMSYYSIWRAINPSMASLALNSDASTLKDLSKLDLSSTKPVIRIEQAAGRTFFWELVQTMDAFYFPAYGMTVATLFDSTAVSSEYHYFQVVAHTTVPTIFWKSAPDSGYSVDNLSPSPPAALAGKQSFTPAGLELTWDRNNETDLNGYHVYRGLTEGFVPGPGNLIATPSDTTLLDSGWQWNSSYYYKVAAVDVHGNESGFALLGPANVTGTDTPRTPAANYLSQNYPNPFNPTTRIAFGISNATHVSLGIYDAAGRLVRALVNDERPAGRYEEFWDGRDANGRAVASGIYFYSLNAGGFADTRKMALIK